jgi:hypothetical protein
MKTQRGLNVGDWLIVVGIALAALLFVASAAAAIVSLRVQTENQHLIREVRDLAQDSNRNHADNLVLSHDLNLFCATYRLTCTAVKP